MFTISNVVSTTECVGEICPSRNNFPDLNGSAADTPLLSTSRMMTVTSHHSHLFICLSIRLHITNTNQDNLVNKLYFILH